MRTFKIQIGRPLLARDTTLDLRIRYFGCYLVVAKTRYGKTALAKHMFVQISKVRKSIIFDVHGEWQRTVTEVNNYSDYPMQLTDYETIENFSFYVSEFGFADWVSLGFTMGSGALIMHRLASAVNIHNNDLKTFTEIINSLPEKGADVKEFNSDYPGLSFPARLAESSVVAIKNRWQNVEHHFMSYKDNFAEGETRNITDWVEEIEKSDNIIIALNVETEFDKLKARAYVGRILEYIKEALWKLQPVIFFEEADYVFPRVSEDSFYMPNSVIQISEYMLKYQKRGVVMFFIVQDTSKIFYDIFQHVHYYILGLLAFEDKLRKIIENAHGLNWDYDANYREFLLVDSSWRYTKFIPSKCCCRC